MSCMHDAALYIDFPVACPVANQFEPDQRILQLKTCKSKPWHTNNGTSRCMTDDLHITVQYWSISQLSVGYIICTVQIAEPDNAPQMQMDKAQSEHRTEAIKKLENSNRNLGLLLTVQYELHQGNLGSRRSYPTQIYIEKSPKKSLRKRTAVTFSIASIWCRTSTTNETENIVRLDSNHRVRTSNCYHRQPTNSNHHSSYQLPSDE